ncbi:MAG: penicillin-binding protein 1A [Hyphomonadaceae bacterium]
MIKKILLGAVAAVALVGVAGAVWVFAITRDLPSEKELANYEPPIMSRVHAGDGRLVAEFASEQRVYVPSEELPDQLINAFVSAEDKTFFEHSGINLWGMFRGTVLNALRGKRMTGGSTITQQTVKNMLVGSERSASRKVREAILAMRLEKQFTKHQILELYLNQIYLGGRSYGVGAAALNYFGKSLSDLSLAECAMLAALPKAPGSVNPYTKPDAAVARRNWVLDRMAINGYITQEDADTAKAEPLETVSRLDNEENQAAAYYVEEVRRKILDLGKSGELEGFANEKDASKGFYEGGLSIRSTLDSKLQLAAQRALRAGLETYDHRRGYRGALDNIDSGDGWADALKAFASSEDGKAKAAGAGRDWRLAVVRSTKGGVKVGVLGDEGETSEGSLASADVSWAGKFKRKDGKSGLLAGDVVLVSKFATPDVSSQKYFDYADPKDPGAKAPWRLRQIPAVQGAVIAMDPHTGRVLAMAGGYSFRRSQYNRAVQAMRQPGSSFKPFVYMAALETGEWTPASLVLDAPYVSCDPTQDKCYKPSNYSEDFYGLSTLRLGIEKSRNAMTVRLANDMGLQRMSELGERLHIYNELKPYEAMSLGAGETTPLRLVTAYASIVNGGKQVKPVLLDRIQNRYGETVYRSDQRPCTGCQVEWTKGLHAPEFPDEREQLLDPVVAYQMVSMLEGVVERGTATVARAVGKPLAAKTGTTNDYADAWTVGFSPDLVAGVWVGFDTPHDMGAGESGGRVAGPIFRDFMMAALKDAPALPFRVPAGVRSVEIDADTGCLPGPNSQRVILEAFKPGTEPTERCEGNEGHRAYRIAYDQISAGDEAVSAPAGTVQPGVTDPNAPGFALTAGGQQPAPDPEMNLDDGVF